MSSDATASSRPPLSLLIAVALLGWIVAGFAFYASSGDRQATEAKLAETETARAALATQLEQQRAAVAQAAELTQKLAAAEADLAQSQARATAAEQHVSGLTADLAARTHERDALQARLESGKSAPAAAQKAPVPPAAAAAPKPPAHKTTP